MLNPSSKCRMTSNRDGSLRLKKRRLIEYINILIEWRRRTAFATFVARRSAR